MDQFAKDQPFEAVELRTQDTKSDLRSFEFEKLPSNVRQKIYRELLLVPEYDDDDECPDDYVNEHEELHARIGRQMINLSDDCNHELHPEIMGTNKKIHQEAATVLYGENWFEWDVQGMEEGSMWLGNWATKTVCTPRYGRLVTNMCLEVSVRGVEGTSFMDPDYSSMALSRTTTNLRKTCEMLCLNDLEVLTVAFYNGLGRMHGGSSRTGFYGERCLEPLKICRAKRVSTVSAPFFSQV